MGGLCAICQAKFFFSFFFNNSSEQKVCFLLPFSCDSPSLSGSWLDELMALKQAVSVDGMGAWGPGRRNGGMREAGTTNFAVVNNVLFDRPHHVALQKHKGDMGDGLLETVEACVCVRVCVQPAANESVQKEYGGMKRSQRANLSSEKVVQKSYGFQANQTGPSRR